MVAHTYKPSTREAEVGESGVQNKHGLHKENLSQKKKGAGGTAAHW
jgi:hypothetical protein